MSARANPFTYANDRDLPVIPIEFKGRQDEQFLRELGMHVPSAEWVAASDALVERMKEAEQVALEGTTLDDQTLWQEIVQQHAALFEQVAAARQPLDEALLAAAEARDRLDQYETTQPNDPAGVTRWAARMSELQLTSRALDDLATQRQHAYEKVAATALDELRNALNHRRATEAYRVTGAKREADALRQQAEDLYRKAAAVEAQAQRAGDALQRLATRLDDDGMEILADGAATVCGVP